MLPRHGLPVLSFCCLAACSSSVPLPARAVALNDSAADAIARGDLSAAEAGLSVALEYSPRFVEAWVNLGYVELRRGNFDQAAHDFARARDLNPDVPAPHHAMGVLEDRRGGGEAAERSYRAALQVDPGFTPARINLARRLFARGQYENAREQFERLQQVAPDEVEGYAGEAETLLALGRGAAAEGVVERARERFGPAPALALVGARFAIARGDTQGAEAMLAPLLGARDRDRACEAWAWIGVARLARGDPLGAGEAAREALSIDHTSAVALYVLGNRRGGVTAEARPPSTPPPR